MEAAASDMGMALQNLADIQSEYQDWLDNLPDSLQGSALGEKLEAVTGLDFELEPDDLLAEVWTAIDEAEGVELPLGFGRD